MKKKNRFKLSFPMASKGSDTSGKNEQDKVMIAGNQELQMHAEDARALLDATAGISDEKIVQARRRLSAALESSRRLIAVEVEKALLPEKGLEQKLREKPYQAMGIAFGIGTLIGCILFAGNSRK